MPVLSFSGGLGMEMAVFVPVLPCGSPNRFRATGRLESLGANGDFCTFWGYHCCANFWLGKVSDDVVVLEVPQHLLVFLDRDGEDKFVVLDFINILMILCFTVFSKQIYILIH